jgi:hypothetical protein
MEGFRRGSRIAPWLYSPKCVEGAFSEVEAENLHPAQTAQDTTAGNRKAGPRSWEGESQRAPGLTMIRL